MSNDEKVTEQMLNAFVDNELDAESRAMVFNNADDSSDVDIKLCEYRKLKDLMRHAYCDVPGMTHAAPTPPYSGFRVTGKTAFAAVVFGIVSAFAGALIGHSVAPAISASDHQLLAAEQSNNVIVHLTSNDVETMDAALTRVEFLLADQRSSGTTFAIELVTNDYGIDLLRSDTSPFAERIAALQDHHVVLLACARRIERLKQAGEDVLLLPRVEHQYTAFERVVDRLESGWRYESI